jgi:hypothetical protein
VLACGMGDPGMILTKIFFFYHYVCSGFQDGKMLFTFSAFAIIIV